MKENYESLSLAALKELAKARGMKGISAAKKSRLIELLRERDAQAEDSAGQTPGSAEKAPVLSAENHTGAGASGMTVPVHRPPASSGEAAAGRGEKAGAFAEPSARKEAEEPSAGTAGRGENAGAFAEPAAGTTGRGEKAGAFAEPSARKEAEEPSAGTAGQGKETLPGTGLTARKASAVQEEEILSGTGLAARREASVPAAEPAAQNREAVPAAGCSDRTEGLVSESTSAFGSRTSAAGTDSYRGRTAAVTETARPLQRRGRIYSEGSRQPGAADGRARNEGKTQYGGTSRTYSENGRGYRDMSRTANGNGEYRGRLRVERPQVVRSSYENHPARTQTAQEGYPARTLSQESRPARTQAVQESYPARTPSQESRPARTQTAQEGYPARTPSQESRPARTQTAQESYPARTLSQESRPAAPSPVLSDTDKPPAELSGLDSGQTVSGILEVMQDGYGFLRSENYLPGENDVYVSPSQIRRFNLKTGDVICGNTRIKTQQEKFSALLYVKSISGMAPSEAMHRCNFEDMTPVFPDRRLRMERGSRAVAMRIVDLFSPIGKGQRGMIVSPPKAGKTTLLKDVARSILQNDPDMQLIILLIDERPEEVTDIREAICGDNVEVIYSTFDELPEHHKRVSEMTIERAKRLVEQKKDVTILLDSITRLARAYNLTVPPSGRTLSGGLDPAALHMPKRFFGAARNMREGGSLTVLATALIDTGSKMDDVVYEEFKGTGNMEMVLDRKLSEKRLFPAIDIPKSGTRREDLLLDREEMEAVEIMRRALNGMKSDDAVENILNMFVHTRDNRELVQRVRRQKYV